MALTVYNFRLSPPARLVTMASEICKTKANYQEVDLSHLEQTAIWFLQVNPARQVPAIAENDKFMAESRDIVKHFFEKYGGPDHWYPKDASKRKEVDEWLDWSKELHLALEQVMIADFASQPGSNWRESGGYSLVLAAKKCTKEGRDRLKSIIDEAERILSKRKFDVVQDLNIGDIATIMEMTVALEMPGYSWNSYPNITKLLFVMKQAPQFQYVHGPFTQFMEDHAKKTKGHPGYGCTGCPSQCFGCVATIAQMIRGKLFVKFCRKK
jgi:glutathione S-transferase